MLIYHPAYDINHCLYRMLLILEHSNHKEFEWDLFRLLDFYVLFPHLMKRIRPFPISLKKYKKFINQIPEAFELIPNSNRVLFELNDFQNVAISNLISKDLVDINSFQLKTVKRTLRELPLPLAQSIIASKQKDAEWFKFIINELPSTIFRGEKGLKSRNNLMEFRYDT